MTAAWAGLEPIPHRVRIGAWTADAVEGGLDDVAIDGVVVLRGIRVVVRDRDWRTVPVVAQRVEEKSGRLRLGFRVEGLGAAFDASLDAAADGDLLELDARLVAEAAFLRNRIGLVVLHAPELAGVPFAVGDEVLRFPERISPHQPARGIRSLAWSAAGRANLLELRGDVFEMEDQRNWTDASYKTYGTPLELPFPVPVEVGEVIRQGASLRSVADPAAPHRPGPAAGEIVLRDGGARMPEIVVGASSTSTPPPVGDLPAEALLVELDLAAPDWEAALAGARAEAAGLPLDVRLIVGDPGELDAALDALAAVDPIRVGAFDARTHVAEPTLLAALESGMRAHGLRGASVGGTRAHFTELNRAAPRLGGGASVAFSVTPEMHDRSTRQLIESVRMQRLVARDAVAIAEGRPVHVGPVTLRARFNAVATSPVPALDLGADTVDPRQHASSLEAWTVASVVALSVEGVASIAYFEAHGPRGLRPDGVASPGPAERALRRVRVFRGHRLLIAEGAPDDVAVLAATAVDGPDGRALVASLRAEPLSLMLRFGDAVIPVDVPAYGVAEVVLPPAR